MSSHVGNYPVECFHIEQLSRKCTCGKTRESYEVIDRQDNDILEILILCPHCAQLTKTGNDMKTKMTVNGVSVCPAGEERYEQFEDRKGKSFFQYDYRRTDGELFSTVAPTLGQCRVRRDKWLSLKTARTTDN